MIDGVRRRDAFMVTAAMMSIAACSSATQSGKRRPQRPTKTASGYAAVFPIAKKAASRHGVPLGFVLGVIHVESRFKSRARSGVGARGLMQLMPKTAAALARRLGYKDFSITDPQFNVDAGTAYLAYLLKRFRRNEALALAAYNTGPGRVSRWQRKGRALPAYSKRYVAAVRRAQLHYGKLIANGSTDDPPPLASPELDRQGLRTLLQYELYGERGDAPPKTLGQQGSD